MIIPIKITKSELENCIFTDGSITLNIEVIQDQKEQRKQYFSDKALNKLASPEFENNILKVYPDEGGNPTIGVGHLLTKSEITSGKIVINGISIKYSNGITEQQSKDLLLQDLDLYEDCVNESVTVSLAQYQYDALIMFCFNIGDGAFKNSTLLKLLNTNNYSEVPTQMRRQNKVTKNGVLIVSQGLVNRREKEIKIWFGSYA